MVVSTKDCPLKKKKKSLKFHLFKTVIIVADIYVPAAIFFNRMYDIIFLGCFYLALKFLFLQLTLVS